MIEKVDIIITTKNRLSELIFTIEQMISIGFSQNQFYVTDDCSTDNTFLKISELFPEINIKSNSVSKICVANRSDMLEWSTNKYILSIDDDSHIRTKEDILEAIEILESNYSYGIFHFRVFNQIQPPPPKSELSNSIHLLRGYVGCGHIFKREVFEKVGRYREDLVFYFEELDYSLRAYKLGYNVVSQDNLIVHHRIDLSLREKQKTTIDSKGIFGRDWRNIHSYSNNLIVTGLYYPIGIDLLMTAYRMLLAFYKMGIKEKQMSGYFRMLSRYFGFIPYIFKHSDKLSYKMFFKWFSYPDMTDGSSVS
jgi:GT2 family glycosyltransferase